MKGFFLVDRLIINRLLSSFDRQREELPTQERRLHEIGKYLAKRAKITPAFLWKLSGIVAILAAVLSFVIAMWAGLAVVCMSALGLYLRIKRIERVRRSSIERDLPALLTSVASSVRAGIDPLQALCDAQAYFPPHSPFVEELRLLRSRLADGEDEVEAIELLMAGENNSDVELFKRCLVLSRMHGSSLAEPIHRVTRVVRQRQSFRRKTRAALAMHRMSAVGIALCSVLIGGMQLTMNLSGITIALKSTVGTVLLSVGGLLIVVGVWWMLLMGREERL